MPNKSEAQRKAMAAAAKGKPNIGIPKSVGREFMASDKGGKLPSKKMLAAAVRNQRKNNMDTG